MALGLEAPQERVVVAALKDGGERHIDTVLRGGHCESLEKSWHELVLSLTLAAGSRRVEVTKPKVSGRRSARGQVALVAFAACSPSEPRGAVQDEQA